MLNVVDEATENDGVRPLNEQTLLSLRYGAAGPTRSLLRYDGETLAGYAHLDLADEEPSGELVVHPAHRGRGHGRLLLRTALELTEGRLRLWSHGDLPAARALAAAEGLTRTRSLWQLRRPLSLPLADVEPPPGVRLRAFVPGRDEEAWLKVNAAAFAHHPEQGAWTSADLAQRERESWFDPAGFFLAVRDDRLVGFHWTKIHDSAEPIGEVYVVGVDPSQQGTGLGKALTVAGLRHLRAKGLAQATLYVDEANSAAIRLYTGLGFSRWSVDVMYTAPR